MAQPPASAHNGQQIKADWNGKHPQRRSQTHPPTDMVSSTLPSSAKPTSSKTIKVSIHTPGVLTSDDLYSFFSEYGKITSHPKIKEDGTPNYVYINFSSGESAREASRVANRTINDVRLTVKLDEKQIKADKHPQRRSEVSFTPPSSAKPVQTSSKTIKVSIHTPGVLTSDDLYSFFSEYGKITSHPKIKEDGTPNYVYINFSSCESAREASRVANRTCNDVRLTVKLQLDEKPVRQIKDDCQRCSEAHPPTAHSVVSSTPPSLAKPLPTSSRIIKVSIHTPGVLTSDDLYGFFSEYGKITCYPEIKEDGTPNYVYINFSSCESAREASRVTNHTCNDVRLTVKLDKKPVKENKTHKVKDTDKLVSFLLTKPPFLQEAEDIAQQHDLSVKLMKNEGPGLLLIGSQISSQAMSQIDGLVDQIKQCLVPEVAPLPCHFIPLFENPKRFQEIEDGHLVELSIDVKGEQPTSLADFSTIVQSKLQTQPSGKAGPTTIDSFMRFFSENENTFFTISCRGEQKNVLAAKVALKEVCEKETVQRDFELRQCTPEMERELLRQASRYLVSTKVVKSTTPATMIITGCCVYADTVKIALKDAYHDLLQKDSTPAHWEPQTKECELKQVQRGTKEWNGIESRVKLTIPHVQIVRLERIQNKLLWKKYSQEREIIEANSGAVNEKELFHGTRGTDPREIYDSDVGFDMRFSAQGMCALFPFQVCTVLAQSLAGLFLSHRLPSMQL